MTLFADRAYKDIIWLESGTRRGPQLDRIGVLIRRGRGLDMVGHPWNISTWETEARDHKFKTSLNNI